MKSEILIQSESFQWSWNTYPETRGLLCYNLNNSANKIQGNQNRGLGLIKGRSDMVLYWKGKAYFLEFKNEVGTQSIDQKNWQIIVENQGFEYYIIKSTEQFKELFTKIITQ